MAIEIRTPEESDFRHIVKVDGRAFHHAYSKVDAQFARQGLELDRFLIAEDAGDVVAVAGVHSMELTMPGGDQLPMAGVTWVGVAVTHRRQGLLRRMMDLVDDQAASRGEPLLGLGASEGNIYHRFGYGTVNQIRQVEIDRRFVEFIDSAPPASGAIRILDAADAIGAMAERWNRYRRNQPGELSRTEGDLRLRMHQAGAAATAALHRDGYAVWTAKENWNAGLPTAAVDIIDFCAVTAEAHADLWKTILSLDMVGPVSSVRAVTERDSLPNLLTNPRVVRTTSLRDNLWLKILDPVACFSARSYRVDDRLVLRCRDVTVAVSADGAEETDDAADLQLAPTAVGPLLMGGLSATELAERGVVEAMTDKILGRADAFFGHSPLPATRLEF